jgi:hypothetical protein
LRLQLGEGLRIFGRKGLGDGGEHLRHLHDRPLEATQCRGKRRRIGRIVALAAEDALPGHARSHGTHVGADAHVARGAG